MNWQDVSDFIELVKNPKKAEDLLAQFKSQKEQLDASIETVGKASEITKLREKAVKIVEAAEKKAVEIEQESNKAALAQKQAYEAMFDSLRKKEEKVDAANQEANSKLEQAKALEATFSKREKDLKVLETQNSKEATRLANLISEYEEKIAKLRSVMG